MDFKEVGTKLPNIPKGTFYYISSWNGVDNLTEENLINIAFEHNDHISYGSININNTIYILSERKTYRGYMYYMFRESDIIKLAQEQGMIKKEINKLPKLWYFECKTLEEEKIVIDYRNKNTKYAGIWHQASTKEELSTYVFYNKLSNNELGCSVIAMLNFKDRVEISFEDWYNNFIESNVLSDNYIRSNDNEEIKDTTLTINIVEKSIKMISWLEDDDCNDIIKEVKSNINKLLESNSDVPNAKITNDIQTVDKYAILDEPVYYDHDNHDYLDNSIIEKYNNFLKRKQSYGRYSLKASDKIYYLSDAKKEYRLRYNSDIITKNELLNTSFSSFKKLNAKEFTEYLTLLMEYHEQNKQKEDGKISSNIAKETRNLPF